MNNNLNVDYAKFYQLFGKDSLTLLKQKPKTVIQMILSNQEELMYFWYQKTNKRFIPDYTVMQNFPKEKIDLFLQKDKLWSNLMKINEYTMFEEGKFALLKLSFIYGVFSNEEVSINKLHFILEGIPKIIDKESYKLLINAENLIENSKENNKIIPTKEEQEEYFNLKEKLYKNNLIKKDANIFSQIYKSYGGNYILTLNVEKNKQIIKSLREFMINWGVNNILTPIIAYNLFRDLKMEYDKDFKTFLFNNFDFFLTNEDYGMYLAKIQENFKEIKKINSNRKISLEIAINFVKEKNYQNVSVGNEELASTISKNVFFNQRDFELIQRIYNHGRKRISSSIPRIKNNYNEFTYEIVRLEDITPLIIGYLTETCQILYDNGEGCLEHSIVDKNGRLFLVKDNNDQIVAHSWVWRNGNILCFDSIEIPNKLLAKIERKKGEQERYSFAKEIYKLYEKASVEIMLFDNAFYKEMFLKGIINEDDYLNLKLNRVTVGLGYNDIASVIKNENKNLSKEITRPYYFDMPLKLERNLYLKDSYIQYILCKIDSKRTNNYSKMPFDFYFDDYLTYDKNNITKEKFLTLNNIMSENNSDKIDTFDSLGKKYLTDNGKIRLIIHCNFVIIYEKKENINRILDLFYLTKIKEENLDISKEVEVQISFALKNLINVEYADVVMEKLSYLEDKKILKKGGK